MLEDILRESARRHKHVCPRQVLGARMSLYAAELLNLDLPRVDKRLIVISETDGCTVDGIIAATGCHVGGRTLRILDLGKVAATFIDSDSGTALRIAPAPVSRSLALDYASSAPNKWQAMLEAYQVMPAEELLTCQPVELIESLDEMISRPDRKTTCEVCGEEVINGREVLEKNIVLCRACAGGSYYRSSAEPTAPGWLNRVRGM
jgi:formylmethanofuran dehydrogenase subunit E